MCGIVGVVGRPPADPETIARMTAQLGHRGPDASGVRRVPGAHIGHTRLSILDLSEAGAQPMRLGQLTLTYNGEIYNFRDLRRELDGPFHSESDTEVVLHAYRQRGRGCVEALTGMFAFAIWDEERRRLFAARDRLGIKPLYYRQLDGALAFASEAAPLLELGTPPLDMGALSDYLTYSYVPTPGTPWQGIHRLPPAHTLTWEDGEFTVARYWQPEPSTESGDFAGAAAELDELFGRVVREHTLADVPVGLFLSGGIDSASVGAYLDQPRTFTLGQPETSRSEAAAARRVAEHFGCRHTEQIAAVPDLGEAIDTIVDVFDEPFGDSAALSVWLLSRFTSEHVKVALSGEGGDETFCGYRWYGPVMTDTSSPWRRLAAALLPTFTVGGRSAQRRAATGLDRYASFLGLFTPQQKRALAGERLRGHADDDLWHFRRHWREELPLHQRLQWADLHTYLPDGMLTKVDRASMAFSLEVRPPMVDHRMVEFSLTLDGRLQRDDGRGKLLLRHLMADRLPAGHLDLPKRGFNLAIRRWARANPGLLRGALSRLATHGILRRPRPFSPTNEQTWALLVLDRWLLRHADFYAAA